MSKYAPLMVSKNIGVSFQSRSRIFCFEILFRFAVNADFEMCLLLLSLSPSPPLNSAKTNKQSRNYHSLLKGVQAIIIVVAHAPLISRIGALPHDLPFRFCTRLQLYQYGCSRPPSPPRFPLSAAIGGLCCEALPTLLRLAPVLSL